MIYTKAVIESHQNILKEKVQSEQKRMCIVSDNNNDNKKIFSVICFRQTLGFKIKIVYIRSSRNKRNNRLYLKHQIIAEQYYNKILLHYNQTTRNDK